MLESHSLQLVLGAARMNEQISLYLSSALKDMGYRGATPSVLSFLSTLECGINYASEIARSLGVSRQMVAKIVRELCEAGYLEQEKAKGKQKQILFTESGERLMSDSRKLLAELDGVLGEAMGQETLQNLVETQRTIETVVQCIREPL